MPAHRALVDGDVSPTMRFVSRVEYVGGPRDAQVEERDELPELIQSHGGAYRRSVRCAEDGAMRYVWQRTTGS